MSSYFNSLSYIAQKRYLTKLNIDGCTLQDPYSIEKSLWSKDMSKWPDLQFGDIYTYDTDLIQRRVCTRVRVQVHANLSITPLEFQRYYSRVRVLSLVCNPRVCHSLG